MDLIQLKIEKDNSAVKYIKVIRGFDSSMSMGDLKRKIDDNDFVVEIDLEESDVLDELSNIDKKQDFRNMIGKLCNVGAKISIYHNGELSSLEFLDNWLNSLDEIACQTDEDIDRETND